MTPEELHTKIMARYRADFNDSTEFARLVTKEFISDQKIPPELIPYESFINEIIRRQMGIIINIVDHRLTLLVSAIIEELSNSHSEN